MRQTALPHTQLCTPHSVLRGTQGNPRGLSGLSHLLLWWLWKGKVLPWSCKDNDRTLELLFTQFLLVFSGGTRDHRLHHCLCSIVSSLLNHAKMKAVNQGRHTELLHPVVTCVCEAEREKAAVPTSLSEKGLHLPAA